LHNTLTVSRKITEIAKQQQKVKNSRFEKKYNAHWIKISGTIIPTPIPAI
jgi:hypothetical protein